MNDLVVKFALALDLLSTRPSNATCRHAIMVVHNEILNITSVSHNLEVFLMIMIGL